MSHSQATQSNANNIPTLFDETHRHKSIQIVDVATMGNRPNLIGFIEHHSSTTDGSFAICLAGGSEVVIKKVRSICFQDVLI